jgi:hypothetical protein
MMITRDHCDERPMNSDNSQLFYRIYNETSSSLKKVKLDFRSGRANCRDLVRVGCQSLANYFVMEGLSGSMVDTNSRKCLSDLDKSINEVISLRYRVA